MDEKNLNKLKKKLEELRDETIKIVNQEDTEKLDGRDVVDEIDQATDMIVESMGSVLSENHRENLQMINEAIEKIEKGQFGLCENCGMEISIKRLEFEPFAKFCVKCKESMEQGK